MNRKSRSELFPGVTFHEEGGPVAIYPNVTIGPGSSVYGPTQIGVPPRGTQPGELPVVIGKEATIRSFGVIYAGVTAGDRFQTGHHFLIHEHNSFGDRCVVGSFSVMSPGCKIGNRVTIHSKVGMAGATVEDDVYLAPGARLPDDPHVPCPRSKECVGGPTIKRGAVIGASGIVMPGVTIGRRALVGAGAIVTRDVPDEMVAAGNPAEIVKRVDELKCWKGFYEHPYVWSEYLKNEPDWDVGEESETGA